MATLVSSLLVEVGSDISGMTKGLTDATSGVDTFAGGVSGQLKSLGKSAGELGGALAGLAAPAIGAFVGAGKLAMDFNEAMTNTGAVLGLSQSEIAGLSAEILAIGETARAGPQAVAEAFYDIVGGVTDASTHMAILEASIATAEAGNADLQATTSALIATMNAYAFSAAEAGFVSDVFTRTVGMGVGTMDQFAAAFPQVTGLAAATGVELDNVAASMAFLTTQGFSASQSATMLQAAMTAVLKPNEDMKAALAAAGLESGSFALENYGLAGTLGRLQNALGGNVDAMASALGTTEALQAATQLNKAEFEDFIVTFTDGIDGATAAAREIQMQSAAAQFDLLMSSLQGLAITVGEALLPSLNSAVNSIKPIIDQFRVWATENPELVTQIATIAFAIGGLGAALIIVGPILSAIGTIVGVVGGAFGVFGTVVGAVGLPVIALGGAIALLIGVLNDPRIQQGLAAWTGVFDQIGIIGSYVFNEIITPAIQDVVDLLAGIWAGVESGINSFVEGMSVAFEFIKTNVIEPVKAAIEGVANALNSLTSGLGAYAGAGENLGAALSSGASPGDFLGALGKAIGQEIGIPGAASGANVHGDGLVYAHAGERILNPAETRAYEGGRGGGGNTYVINAYGENPHELARKIQQAIREQGM